MITRLLLAAALALAAFPAAAAVVALRDAQARFAPEGQPASGEQPVRLPHRWDKSFPGQAGTAVYRLELPPPQTDAPHALFFPRIGNQAEVVIGGEVIRQLGQLGVPTQDHAKAPVWIDLPRSRLLDGRPTPLEVRISAQAGRWGGLAGPVFGPAAELRPLYQVNYRWRQGASIVIVLALGLMSLMAGGLWWRQRDALYGLLAFTAVFGVVRMSDRLLVEPPLPWPLWGAVTACAFALHLLLLARFALEAVDLRAAWVRRGFWISTGAACAAAMAGFLLARPGLWTAALAALAIGPGMAVLVGCSQRAWTTRSRQSVLLCLAGFLVILTGVRDFLVVRLAESGSGSFSLLPHAVFVFVLFMGWIVVDRYSEQVAQFRELNASLGRRIAEREEQLSASHRLLTQQSEQQAALQERQRIMRDIHDGVGAHLVSLLNLVNQGTVKGPELQAEINLALDELRMAVDSMQPVDGDLAAVLGTLRYRLQPRLLAAGLAMHWDVDALPPLPGLTPQVVLQVQRILLETFTNIVRHGRAKSVSVWARTLEDPPRVALEVSDDGCGFQAGAAAGGMGLRNMRARCEAIGGTLDIRSLPGQGCAVRLELPRA